MKRVVFDRVLTARQMITLAEWATVNQIPLVEIWNGQYTGRREISEFYQGSGIRLGEMEITLMVREADADLVMIYCGG